MELVKATEAKLRFPVLGYIPDGELTGWPDLWWLTIYKPKLFKKGIYEGMILIDANRRRWIARSAYLTGQIRRTRWWPLWPFPDNAHTRVQFELEEIDRISLTELIDLVCKSEMDGRRLWAWHRKVPEHQFQKHLDKIRAAKTVGRIFSIMDFYIEPGFWWGRK